MIKKLVAGVLLAATLVTLIGGGNVSAAGTCNFSINGNSSVYNGQTLTLTVGLSSNGTNGGIRNAQGYFNVSGSFSIVSASSLNSNFTVNTDTGRFVGAAMTGINGSFNMVSIVVKASSVGSGALNLTSLAAGDTDGPVSCNTSTSKPLTSTTPPSANANLASLSVSGQSIKPSFSASNTKYNLSVGSKVTSITVNASSADSGAKISGTGNRNLQYGDNTISIIVTAPAGNTKTYTITVNRQDDRSSDNKLKSLKPSTGSINFSPNTTTYHMEVPFSVEKVNFTAVANDPKTKVSISTPDLVAEETRAATITVTAENGSTKTYTINIKRSKDPNKPLSHENKLESLSANVGILSPVFSPDKTNYAIYLPFEITKIIFEYTAVEKKYSTITKTGSDDLALGVNKIIFKVTAEDGETREYTVTVHRFDQVGAESEEKSNDTKTKPHAPAKENFNVIPYLIGGAISLVICMVGWFLYIIINRRRGVDKNNGGHREKNHFNTGK